MAETALTRAAIRALPVRDRVVVRDVSNEVWRGDTDRAAGTYTHDGADAIVPTDGDGSAAWVRVGGSLLPLAQDITSRGNVSTFSADLAKGWVDCPGQLIPFPIGAGRPSFTAMSAPHGNIYGYAYGVNDVATWRGHIMHGVDPAAGIFLHVHFFIDGTSTETVKFELEYSYAHGYSRQAYSAPATVTVEQAGTGTAKTHQIAEISTAVLVDGIETDGIVLVNCKRVTNGGTDVADPVFVHFVDAHCRQTHLASTNRNYPFE